jgi:Amt family ammonium transporter
MTETTFIFNTFFLFICGVLVMFMSAGFAMLEAGTVRSKSVGTILVKNVGIYAVAGIMFLLFGYNLMYKNVDGGFFGIPLPWMPDDSAALAGDFSAGHSSAANWFFQMVFVATAASVVSGALAERIKIWPFMFFCVLLTGVIYPLVGSWTWGGGWLSAMGFKDFAGSTIVHSVGGWAALTGAIVLGARRRRFDAQGRAKALPNSSLPLMTMGTFILWFGWFGFNAGSQLAIASLEDAIAVGKILVNTNTAAAAAVVTVMLFYKATGRNIDLSMMLNGALAGLVAITAEPLTPTIPMAIFAGASGALIMILASKGLESLKIDDVVGAVPVHLAAGIWGTLLVPLSNTDASFVTQCAGIVAVGGFVGTSSLLIWMAMKATVSIRLHWSHEDMGADLSELGVRAHNLEYS